MLHAGLDIGSTTAKAVVLDGSDRVIHSSYRRHNADIGSTTRDIMGEIARTCGTSRLTMAIAGSGALGMAEGLCVPFAQELVACSTTVEHMLSGVDVAIELGGEDAKLTFFDSAGIDQRMNETCAGGTGAFIDQMAVLLGTDAAGLNELAKGCKTIYPIASRCGVFAKTDIQPLINDGASKSDLAASIFQAIVNQTISGLACGRKIKGRVAFLGGPLYFLSELRKRFVETLGLSADEYIFPENPHLFVAIGAALLGKKAEAVDIESIVGRARTFFQTHRPKDINVLPALFMTEDDRASFKDRHGANKITRLPLAEYTGDAYLGVDVGSTTIKVVLIGRDGELLFSRYSVSNSGEPVKTVKRCLIEMYDEMPKTVNIVGSAVTGYGEKLVQSAFGLDVGEVETVAHARAAEFVLPGADFVIDIGGQDMKCLGIKGGVIDRVFLNEACSSGCGSFLQTFAESLHMSVEDFARIAERSMMPVDLGSRCTVFMNSRVRQAQKEGSSVADISAGLVYSIVRNALYKVLKIRSMDDIGDSIVVQGGAFKNDALLRAFEMITGKDVVRPEISELMGAFGAALIARDSAAEGRRGSMISREELESLDAETSTSRCGGCGNNCILTITRFDNGRRYISGNKCERGGMTVEASADDAPVDLCAEKYRRLFDAYRPLDPASAPRGTIGIPRALNMYEDYPFWFTFFTKLGFCVELSSAMPDENLGIDSVPSQTLCYPAKLVHRHIEDLLSRGIRRIFYPLIQREELEFADAHKNFNCPVVIGYPDAAYLNIDGLHAPDVEFLHPSLPFSLDDPRGRMERRICEEMPSLGLSLSEIRDALKAAAAEQRHFKADVRAMGDRTLKMLAERGKIGIVLAGHPYHLDPAVNHGIPKIINSYGVSVLTEDSVCSRADEIGGVGDLYVVDQWVFHSRLYRTAAVIARHPEFRDIQMIQLNSFGCGLDAISADQAAAVLAGSGKLHTLIKIDEGSNNGAVKIRIRSLLASVRKDRRGRTPAPQAIPSRRLRRRPADLDGRVVLCPPLSSYHMHFFETAIQSCGVDMRVLPEGGRDAVELALKHVNNDACYPSMFVVGQFLEALGSGKYDLDRTDCLYAQTGGACRASNYVPLLRKALDSAGYRNVRIIAANAQANSGAERFSPTPKMIWRCAQGMIYGDILMKLTLATRPYETEKGSTDALLAKWRGVIDQELARGKWSSFKNNISRIVRDFSELPVDLTPKPRVGVVGEILVKYHANSNEHLVETIEAEGGEAVVPDMASFLLYCMMDHVFAGIYNDGPRLASWLCRIGAGLFERMRRPMARALAGTRFSATHDIYHMAQKGSSLVSLANQAGEGWLLTAEMVNLIESGVKNVICVQPFGCLPNHITGKGVVKELKRRYPSANILPLDFDASVSNVNQLNRIKLLMATAKI